MGKSLKSLGISRHKYILKKLFVLNFIIFPMFLSQKSLKKLTSKGEIFVQFPTVLINTILSPMFFNSPRWSLFSQVFEKLKVLRVKSLLLAISNGYTLNSSVNEIPKLVIQHDSLFTF